MQLFISSLGNAVEVSFSPAYPTSRPFSRARRAALLVFSTSLIFGSTALLQASQKNHLEISLIAQRVVAMSNGGETLIADAAAGPGDVLLYTASYRNKSDGTLSRLAPTLPIPNGTEYIPERTMPGPSEGSLDGKTFERFPIHRTKKLADGIEVLVEVPAKSIRALRWQVGDLAPSAAFVAAARVRVTSSSYFQA